MTRYVIGDSHGNYKGLLQVLEKCKFDYDEDELISLGDECVIGNTKITTNTTDKPIKDISVGDMVLTHTGKYQKVVKIHRRDINEDICKIDTYNDTLYITKTHPIFNNPTWEAAGNIKPDDYVYYPINDQDNIDKIDIFEYCGEFAYLDDDTLYSENDRIKSTKINRYYKLNNRNLRIIGYFIGDGNRRFVQKRGTISFSFGDTRKEDVMKTDLLDWCNESYINYYLSKHGNMNTIHINSKILASFFHSFYNINNEKIISAELSNISNEQFLWLLYGLIITDGCFDNKRIRFNNTSKILIDQIVHKLRKCGIIPSVCISRPETTMRMVSGQICNTKTYYEITLRNSTTRKIFELLNIDKDIFLNSRNGYIENGFIKMKVKASTLIPYNGMVYNLEVENDNSYVANNICVHNCDGFPESKQIFDEFLKIKNLKIIMGNHTQWLYDWFRTGAQPAIWVKQGGLSTLKSYDYLFNEEHKKLLDTSVYYYLDDDNNLFVHGGIKPNIPLSDQDPYEIMWDRNLFKTAVTKQKYSSDRNKNLTGYKNVFIGHTTTSMYKTLKPMFVCEVINLDTGSGYEGKVTLMNIETHEYFQSDLSEDLYGPNQGRG